MAGSVPALALSFSVDRRVDQLKDTLGGGQRGLRLRVGGADQLQRPEQVLHIGQKRHHDADADIAIVNARYPP